MDVLQCIRCDKFLEASMFVGKTGKKIKTCSNCRQKTLQYYYTSKSIGDVPSDDCLIELEEVKKQLSEQILETGKDEHIESESGIEFSCKISITSLSGTPQEIGKKIANIIGCADGYYYM
jgi:hypothetical protein